ncbi:WXG100 family type VII secretion target [Ectobacillus sp. JY-23]|uniref:WXG100 family type VII secretion target n=1 Tax=Ectobacillus sp. JY-23 TaxID=2933872 RepID=UPI001FF37179|nr:WXG100 family type VII secretion target [Ectobacillus sp. JY-23]UOY92301.1 WXG100 family type VII secretion target [Ectobacillus sp. JY-23]
MRIQVRPERLEEVAGQFARAREESAQLIGSMTKSMHTLEARWHGVGKERFYSRYHEANRTLD